MKKLIAMFVVCAFVVTVAGIAFGRTLEEEKQAVRDYLKVVDAKIVKYRKAGNTAKVKKLQGEKAATLQRWEKLKASTAVAPIAPPPPPSAPAAAPAMGAQAGMFGWGINTLLTAGYLNTGKGSISGSALLRGDVVLEDMLGLGGMVGLNANAVKYTVGLGGVYGGGGMKAIPLYVGGIINLPADMMGGLETYLSGGLNYVIYGNLQTSGKIGGDIYYGLKADVGLGLGKTGFAVGYSIVRSTNHSDKSVSVVVSQPIVL